MEQKSQILKSRSIILKWLFQTGVMVCLGLAFISLWFFIPDLIHDDGLFISNRILSFGDVPQGWKGSLAFHARNVSAEPVRILGARSSCTCALIEDLPITLAPGEARELNVRIRADGELGSVSQAISLYTSVVSQSEIKLVVRGNIMPVRAD